MSHENGNYDKYKKCYHLDHDSLFCKFCKKLCKNKNSLVQHEIRCKLNPNKIATSLNFHVGHSAWNKGLTKDTDERVRKNGESVSNTFKLIGGTFKGKHHSKETIEKMKNNPNCGGLRSKSGRSKQGWYKGIYCRSTYELVYVIYNLDHNIDFKPCTRIYEYLWENEIHKYYPDFELPDGTIIEIKGYSNNQTLAKINSVKDRDIKVLYKKDLKYAFDYVENNYDYKKLEDLYESGDFA